MLRVISGLARGLKLRTPEGSNTRPTTDRVKESLFNILAPYIQDGIVLDLFSGTGSLAIEALSRGAKSAVLVDRSADCCSIIRENLVTTKFNNSSKVLNLDFKAAIDKLSQDKERFDLVFLDPPYSKGLIDVCLKSLSEKNILNNKAIVIAEKHIDDILPEKEGNLVMVRKQKYGEIEVCFYSYRE